MSDKPKKPECPKCGSTNGYARIDKSRVCRACGHTWQNKEKNDD